MPVSSEIYNKEALFLSGAFAIDAVSRRCFDLYIAKFFRIDVPWALMRSDRIRQAIRMQRLRGCRMPDAGMAAALNSAFEAKGKAWD
ncbi:MAG: hypothetical protein ABWY05_17415 [Noviherbaspirillum sp.]